MGLNDFHVVSVDRRRSSSIAPIDAQVSLVTCARAEHVWFGAPAPVGEGFESRSGVEAVQHLFRIAAGLESPLLGEYEVLGQFRRAVDSSADLGRLGPELTSIMRAAVNAGRVARQRTRLGSLATSYADVAAQLATTHGPRVGILGSGSLARRTAEALLSRGVKPAGIVARHPERLPASLAKYTRADLSLNKVPHWAGSLDVLITAVSARHLLSLHEFGNTPGLFVIDLGRPANVDPAPGSAHTVIGLDQMSAGSPELRRAADEASAFIDQSVKRFVGGWDVAVRRRTVRPWQVRRKGDAA